MAPGFLGMAVPKPAVTLDAAPDLGSLIPVRWLPETCWAPILRRSTARVYQCGKGQELREVSIAAVEH
jgi:hypothetical protein